MKRIGHYRIIQSNDVSIIYGRNCEPIAKRGSLEKAERYVMRRIELVKQRSK